MKFISFEFMFKNDNSNLTFDVKTKIFTSMLNYYSLRLKTSKQSNPLAKFHIEDDIYNVDDMYYSKKALSLKKQRYKNKLGDKPKFKSKNKSRQ